MRGLRLLLLCVLLPAGCGGTDQSRAVATSAAAPALPTHLAVSGSEFRKGATAFEWRGISAFRLAEMLAHGREPDVVRYLDWASAQQLTVVRVFLMAHHLFKLVPDAGRTALPRLLTLAAERGLHVEIVALVDTAEIDVDHRAHVKAVGAVAAVHHNALVEIANEPWHPTQNARLHDPAYVKALADLVPSSVPVALGSAEKDPAYAAGRYATWHAPRLSGEGGWAHVLALAEGARLVEDWRKPVVSDEPVGAAAQTIPGRRDHDPARFAAAAALSRLAGLGATFHYERGLQAQLPAGRELECFAAWRGGLNLLRDLPRGGTFLNADETPKVADVRGVRAAFGRSYASETWIAAIEPRNEASAALRSGESLNMVGQANGVRIYRRAR
jgi:hypothetical protein